MDYWVAIKNFKKASNIKTEKIIKQFDTNYFAKDLYVMPSFVDFKIINMKKEKKINGIDNYWDFFGFTGVESQYTKYLPNYQRSKIYCDSLIFGFKKNIIKQVEKYINATSGEILSNDSLHIGSYLSYLRDTLKYNKIDSIKLPDSTYNTLVKYNRDMVLIVDCKFYVIPTNYGGAGALSGVALVCYYLFNLKSNYLQYYEYRHSRVNRPTIRASLYTNWYSNLRMGELTKEMLPLLKQNKNFIEKQKKIKHEK